MNAEGGLADGNIASASHLNLDLLTSFRRAERMPCNLHGKAYRRIPLNRFINRVGAPGRKHQLHTRSRKQLYGRIIPVRRIRNQNIIFVLRRNQIAVHIPDRVIVSDLVRAVRTGIIQRRRLDPEPSAFIYRYGLRYSGLVERLFRFFFVVFDPAHADRFRRRALQAGDGKIQLFTIVYLYLGRTRYGNRQISRKTAAPVVCSDVCDLCSIVRGNSVAESSVRSTGIQLVPAAVIKRPKAHHLDIIHIKFRIIQIYVFPAVCRSGGQRAAFCRPGSLLRLRHRHPGRHAGVNRELRHGIAAFGKIIHGIGFPGSYGHGTQFIFRIVSFFCLGPVHPVIVYCTVSSGSACSQGQDPGRPVDVKTAFVSCGHSLRSLSHLKLITVRSRNLLDGVHRGAEVRKLLLRLARLEGNDLIHLPVVAGGSMLIMRPVGDPVPEYLIPCVRRALKGKYGIVPEPHLMFPAADQHSGIGRRTRHVIVVSLFIRDIDIVRKLGHHNIKGPVGTVHFRFPDLLAVFSFPGKGKGDVYRHRFVAVSSRPGDLEGVGLVFRLFFHLFRQLFSFVIRLFKIE